MPNLFGSATLIDTGETVSAAEHRQHAESLPRSWAMRHELDLPESKQATVAYNAELIPVTCISANLQTFPNLKEVLPQLGLPAAYPVR